MCIIMTIKVCAECGSEKSIDCFYKDKRGKHGVRAVCKACESSRKTLYRSKNREHISSYLKQYNQQNKDYVVAYKKKYRQDNSYRLNAINAHRRANKMRATPSWVDRKAIIGMYHLAALFNKTGISMQVDHIVPLQSDLVCGLHCEANLQLLSATNNLTKGNHHWPDMW